MNHLSDNTLLRGGTYRIIRFLSSGGFGCTYEAEHVMLHKHVAIKEFFPNDFCNRDESTSHVTVGTQSKKTLVEKLRRKFMEEAIALSQLQHPGIVRVTDVFEENDTAYYVMDFIDGISLNDMVTKTGAVAEDKAVGYIRQVADALKYVHSHNRLHLDVKPANIMVDKEGHAILIDFGASKQYDEEKGENTSTLMGKTPGFAPIEQMGNDVVKFTPATDIYALGATLYKLLTGKTPPSATLLASGEDLPPLPENVSPGVKDAVVEAMKPGKNQRPQTIDDFLSYFGNSVSGGDIIVAGNTNDDKTILEEDDPPVIVKPQTDVVVIGSSPKKEKPAQDKGTKRMVVFFIGLGVCLIVGLAIKLYDSRASDNIDPDSEVYVPEEIDTLSVAGDNLWEIEQNKAQQLYTQKKYTEAFPIFEKYAEEGSSFSQYFLGCYYYYGHAPVEEDMRTAFTWLYRSADQGDPDAAYILGWMYEFGQGVDVSRQKAIHWYKKSNGSNDSAERIKALSESE